MQLFLTVIEYYIYMYVAMELARGRGDWESTCSCVLCSPCCVVLLLIKAACQLLHMYRYRKWFHNPQMWISSLLQADPQRSSSHRRQ